MFSEILGVAIVITAVIVWLVGFALVTETRRTRRFNRENRELFDRLTHFGPEQ